MLQRSNKPCYADLIIGFSVIACIAGYFGLLNYYSFDISSDDALYFQRALTYFSVLEFSPHFPGYPGFVWFERSIAAITSHPNSNVLLSFLSAIALTFSVFVYCYQRMQSKGFTVLAVMLFLLQGNIAELAFNGLSDATALWFFSLYLLQAHLYTQAATDVSTRKTYSAISSGLLLAACLATRPSYLPLVTSALVLECIYHAQGLQRFRRLGWQIFSITILGLFCAGYVFMQDGWAYIEEGQRFTQGHFTIWGNTTNTTDPLLQQWLTTLNNTYSSLGLTLLATSLIIGIYIPKTRGLSIIACCWFAWIIRGQNPENIRHLAVFSLLLPIITAQLVEHFYTQNSYLQKSIHPILYVVSIILLVTLGHHSLKQFSTQKNAPVLQATQFFTTMNTQQIIISNYNIDNLRHTLPQHVILDRHYQSSSNYQAQQQGYWRLSSNALDTDKLINGGLVTQFTGRFLGERSLYLYYFDPNHLSTQS
ncbi:hypothetical protein FR932_04945 [Moritella marina ATCC 15381]|uniref:Glycosyltransferase RgtA/B/C/D-like domain-containing protein n=1 Tax=Moritella marina ATCC 15381 TaxID=1202962 RepID=A0A5J6WGN5_MORMI|nr:hypothetical protein [Moritella marina]QFI37219.1 hypothetical protein FR932_04945 [Moritella marina ATCC 15381]